MIHLDLNNGQPPYMVGFDSKDTVNVVPDRLSFLLEWERGAVLGLCVYRGWKVTEDNS